MGCCDMKQGTGKCMVFFFTVIFALGVTISTLSPNWIGFHAEDKTREGVTIQIEYGPFYGQSRHCTSILDAVSGNTITTCTGWESKEVNLDDCDKIGDSSEEKLCNHLATWRVMGVFCLLLTLGGAGLVLAASCCQCLTCGCCGNSLTCISNVLFWAEVLLSIVTWSFTISSYRLIKGAATVSSTEYQWGFWLFIASGTILGAIAAWMADWAAEDSALRGIWQCLTCHSCRNKEKSDERGAPLLPDDRA